LTFGCPSHQQCTTGTAAAEMHHFNPFSIGIHSKLNLILI